MSPRFSAALHCYLCIRSQYLAVGFFSRKILVSEPITNALINVAYILLDNKTLLISVGDRNLTNYNLHKNFNQILVISPKMLVFSIKNNLLNKNRWYSKKNRWIIRRQVFVTLMMRWGSPRDYRRCRIHRHLLKLINS